MRVSETRILTTHTGSLPRPPSLVELYVRKARGEPVDAELAEAGHAAMEDVVRRQRDAGIDIGNNGEQQREAFVLYVRGRMSGFGGSWNRPPRGDVDRYPQFKEAMAKEIARLNWISQRDDPPKALSDIRRRIPLGHRMTDAAEIAAMAVFLLSPTQSAHTTGQHIVVDGGYTHLDRALT